MHTIVMWLGGITAALGAFFIHMMIVTTTGGTGAGGGATVLIAIATGGGLILSGAMLYCFGAIVQHLRAIRRASERQAEIFERMGKRPT